MEKHWCNQGRVCPVVASWGQTCTLGKVVSEGTRCEGDMTCLRRNKKDSGLRHDTSSDMLPPPLVAGFGWVVNHRFPLGNGSSRQDIWKVLQGLLLMRRSLQKSKVPIKRQWSDYKKHGTI